MHVGAGRSLVVPLERAIGPKPTPLHVVVQLLDAAREPLEEPEARAENAAAKPHLSLNASSPVWNDELVLWLERPVASRATYVLLSVLGGETPALFAFGPRPPHVLGEALFELALLREANLQAMELTLGLTLGLGAAEGGPATAGGSVSVRATWFRVEEWVEVLRPNQNEPNQTDSTKPNCGL